MHHDDKVAASAPGTTGGCLCGAVRFEIRGPLRDVTTCHCTMCARAGTSVGAYTACAPERLVLTSRDPTWYVSSPEARRGFCPSCGSQLFWAPADGDHISISAGAIDDPAALVWGEHIYVDGSDVRRRRNVKCPPDDDPAGIPLVRSGPRPGRVD